MGEYGIALTIAAEQPMRFHKAVEISRPEADFIICTATSSHNDLAVINHYGTWYDIRSLTGRGLKEFVADLLRAELSNVRTACITPH